MLLPSLTTAASPTSVRRPSSQPDGRTDGGAAGGRRRNQQDVGNILGALYLAVLFLGIINSRTVQAPASYERSVMYRERAAGMYNELPFALAQCCIEVPYNLLQSILFSCIGTPPTPPPPPPQHTHTHTQNTHPSPQTSSLRCIRDRPRPI